ncbi:MAG TPA: amidohydrolase family protein [Chloroflexota bacterium]|nr:amidohydrolase family protein [Chloroflexota bacterium]
MTVVDIHPHVIAADHACYPLAPVAGGLSAWARERPVTCEQLLAAMDAAGVDQAALVQAATAHGYDNRYTADSAAAHPARLTWVGTLDTLAPETPDQLTYWVRERGMAGLRVYTAGSTMAGQAPWLGDPASFPTWERARDLGIPVCVQMRPEGVPALHALLARFPDVRMILDHFGRAPLADGPPFAAAAPLFALAAYPNVYVKLTTHTYHAATQGQSTPQAFLARLVEAFGTERIAWGSNFPASEGTLAELVALARDWVSFLPAADQQRILGETALALYPRLAGKS